MTSHPSAPHSNPPRQIDVADGDFDRLVLEESARRPVAVDFWAPWCGPCRNLAPLLERLAEEHRGAFLLAKVDIDQCPETASRFGVRSVPMVMGFRDGQAVHQFTGAQPEAALRRFLDQLLPSAGDELVREARGLLEAARRAEGEALLRQALELEPRNDAARLALAECLAASEGQDGETRKPEALLAEAVELLENIGPGAPQEAEARRLAARLRTLGTAGLGTASTGGGATAALREAVAAEPKNAGHLLALGCSLAAEEAHREALETLIEALRVDPDYEDQAARKSILDLFEVLGGDHELTAEFRRKLAAALYR